MRNLEGEGPGSEGRGGEAGRGSKGRGGEEGCGSKGPKGGG